MNVNLENVVWNIQKLYNNEILDMIASSAVIDLLTTFHSYINECVHTVFVVTCQEWTPTAIIDNNEIEDKQVLTIVVVTDGEV